MIRRQKHLSYGGRLRLGLLQHGEGSGDTLKQLLVLNVADKFGEQLLTRAHSDRIRQGIALN